MRNADYWRGRFSILEDSAHREAQKTIQGMEELYLDAQRSVQKEIESWYARFAVNNQISLTDARKWLTAGQLEEFHWSVEQYIKIGEQAGLDAAWLKKLENASTRFHISRLEAVQTGIQQQLELLYGNQVDSLDALLKKVVGNGYTHTAFEVQKGVGLGWDITGLNQKKLETLLSKPWTTDGRTFRDRCWLNKNDLVGSVSKSLTQGLLRGDSPAKITTAIQKQFGVHRYKVGRLVNTETTYFNAVATKECYKDLDVEMVEIIETLDSHTCSICGGLDGKVIPISQYKPGVTVPPFHPNCRGTTAPAIDPKYAGERAARNADGNVYYIPANMKYADWKKAFADGGSKVGLTKAAIGTIMNLTDLEQWAIREYISSGSYKINASLRTGGELSDKEKELIRHLDSALAKLPVYQGTVYRSITDFGIDDLDAFWAEYTVGGIVQFPAYTSAGTEVYDDSFPIQYIIKSKHGRDVRKYNSRECEVLFPRNSKFRVIKVENGSIFMEEL